MNFINDFMPYISSVQGWTAGQLTLREWLHDNNNLTMASKEIRCYSCQTTEHTLTLRQMPQLSRCSDEIIETHYFCTRCVG